ncbi:hypothetical protein [Belliella filtrata]|nr:hypothetical protein [Belliella filtrata]
MDAIDSDFNVMGYEPIYPEVASDNYLSLGQNFTSFGAVAKKAYL